jgi:hypothetical protein
MNRPGIWLLALIVGGTGCTGSLLGTESGEDPVILFDELWGEFDRYYSFFGLKQVDWVDVGARHRARVQAKTTPAELLGVIGEMLDELRDGHITVWAPFATYSWTGWYVPYPASFAWDRTAPYLPGGGILVAGGVRWGRVASGVGYIHIPHFEDRSVLNGLDAALTALDKDAALIIDVRHNGGGSDTYAVATAGRFADQRYHYRSVSYRNGPGHDDFTEPRKDYVQPEGKAASHHRVMLLTNRRVFSAAEDFVLAMRSLPQVTVVGDTTGGGAGNPITRELSNGWVYRIPRWLVWTPEGQTYEGVGLAPDVAIRFDPADPTRSGDPILEAAIARLLTGG